jgi:hypothetical protein
MNLPHRGWRKMLPAKLMKKQAAILLHPLTLVGLRETEV